MLFYIGNSVFKYKEGGIVANELILVKKKKNTILFEKYKNEKLLHT
jgi:hypothetical protein